MNKSVELSIADFIDESATISVHRVAYVCHLCRFQYPNKSSNQKKKKNVSI